MVNTGHPSRDCETCRQRRVKCDLRRPACERCEKIGRPCSGYRDLSKPKLTFRVQTPSTFVGRRRHPRDAVRIAEARRTREINTFTEPESTNEQSRRASSSQLSPTRSVSESWELHIKPWIVYSFSFRSSRGGRVRGAFECFPHILRSAQPESVLDLVSKAVGYIYLANRTKSLDSVVKHRKMYCRALQELQKALIDPTQQSQDATLFAVWLACLYELMLGDPSDGPNDGLVNWDIHARALGKLLQLRGFSQFETKTGCQLFQLAYHKIQIESLNSITNPASEARDLFATIQLRLGTNELFFLPPLFYGDEVVRMCRNAYTSFNEASSTTEKVAVIDHLVQNCYRLEATLDKSVEDLPCTMNTAMSASVHSVKASHQGELRMHNHVDACLLRAHAIALELMSSALKLPDLSSESARYVMLVQEAITVQSQNRANRIVDNLLSLLPVDETIPSSWAESLSMMWPLRMVIRSPVSNHESKHIAKLALRRMAYHTGLVQAVAPFSRHNQPAIEF